MSLSTLTKRNKNAGRTPYVYDLNIFKRELEQEDGSYKHDGPWYIHIYEYDGRTTEEVSEPILITNQEASNLIENDPYFQDHEPDLWYGLEGFMLSKWDAMSDRLKARFEGLPKYKD